MTLQERKDKADIIAKEADIVHKKMIPLLATAAGAGSYAIIFLKDELYILGFLLLLIFIMMAIGIVINYQELSSLKNKIKELGNDE